MRTIADDAGQGLDPDRVGRVRDHGLSADDAARLGELLTLMADPVRVRILDALDLVGELCVSDIARSIDATDDAVSYGLRMLRAAGLVQTRKQGRTVHYRLAASFPEPLLEHCLRELLHLSRLAGGNAAAPARQAAGTRVTARRRASR